MTRCACGCGRAVTGKGARFASRQCWYGTLTPDYYRAIRPRPAPAPLIVCPCGCGGQFPSVKKGRIRKYATRACSTRVRSGPEWASWQHDRARKSALASNAIRRQKALARAEIYETKAAAYDAGDKAGYQRGERWWKHNNRLLRAENERLRAVIARLEKGVAA